MRSLGAGYHAQNPLAVLIANHAGQKSARGLATSGTKLLEHATDAHRLQSGEFERQCLARRGYIKEPLPPIGALPEEAARERAALERAGALLPSLALIPLYAQGLRAAMSERVASLVLDGHGLPTLDDAFLLPE